MGVTIIGEVSYHNELCVTIDQLLIGNCHCYMIQLRLEYQMLILLQDISCVELTGDCMKSFPLLHRGVSCGSHDPVLPNVI